MIRIYSFIFYSFLTRLSAVDAHVGRHIFDHVIGPNGLLKEKSRLFVTHAIQFLSKCDLTMMISNGRIIEGPLPFNTLMKSSQYKNVKNLVTEFLTERNNGFEGLDVNEDALSMNNDSIRDDELNELAEIAGVSLSKSQSSQKSVKSMKSAASKKRPKVIVPLPRKLSTKSSKAPKAAGVNIISKEESATGSVKWDVYLYYMTANSFISVLVVIILMVYLFSCFNHVLDCGPSILSW